MREDPLHTDFIKSLHCVVCGATPVDPHHVRVSMFNTIPDGCITVPDSERGGTGLKPADKWTVPVCRIHHDHIHAGGERIFWLALNINPLALAQSLYANSGNRSAAMGTLNRVRNGGML